MEFPGTTNKTMAWLAGGAVLTGSLMSCATMTTNVAPPVNPAMLRAARGTTGEELDEGRRIFAGTCTACHNADPVGKYSVAQWRKIIDDDMGDRARLDAKARAALLAYISAVAAR